MKTQNKMLIICSIIIISCLYSMILVSNDQQELPSDEYVFVEQTPRIPVATPTPETIPTIIVPTPNKINPVDDLVNRFDHDGNGCLSSKELGKLRDVYNNGFLTKVEEQAYREIMGTSKLPNPTPTKTPKPEPKKGDFTCSDLYNMKCPDVVEGNVYEYLKYWEWNANNQYEVNKFDCSQMSAYMEWMLETSGYNCVIRTANVEGEQHGHAWILVEFSNGWLAYECTDCYWVYPNKETAKSFGGGVYNPSFYTAGKQYNSICDIFEDYKQYSDGEEAFIQDWAWWIE